MELRVKLQKSVRDQYGTCSFTPPDKCMYLMDVNKLPSISFAKYLNCVYEADTILCPFEILICIQSRFLFSEKDSL